MIQYGKIYGEMHPHLLSDWSTIDLLSKCIGIEMEHSLETIFKKTNWIFKNKMKMS